MHKMSAQCRNGFSLIELLLYICILGIMVLAFATYLPAVYDARARRQVVEEVDEQGTQAMEIIASSIRSATSITTPLAGASSSTLVLVMTDALKNPTRFSVNGTTLTMQEGVGAAVSLTNARVLTTQLAFTNAASGDSPGSVRADMEVRYATTTNQPRYQYVQTFRRTATVRQ